jgi:hypothetical protein
LSGSPITVKSVTKSALFGALGGAFGNRLGLDGALNGVRKRGMGVADALARGDRIGSGTGTGIATFANTRVDTAITAIKSFFSTDRECECSR